jgi:hypothetical protein
VAPPGVVKLETIPNSKQESVFVNIYPGNLFWEKFPVSILIPACQDYPD